MERPQKTMWTSVLRTQVSRVDTAITAIFSFPDHLANEFTNSRKRDMCSVVVTHLSCECECGFLYSCFHGHVFVRCLAGSLSSVTDGCRLADEHSPGGLISSSVGLVIPCVTRHSAAACRLGSSLVDTKDGCAFANRVLEDLVTRVEKCPTLCSPRFPGLR